jgi:hypothetical protein
MVRVHAGQPLLKSPRIRLNTSFAGFLLVAPGGTQRRQKAPKGVDFWQRIGSE